MALLGGVGESTVDKIDKETLPEISAELKAVLDQFQAILDAFLDRLNGAKLIVSSASATLQIPPKKGS
jgi:hypothetical protein